MRKDLILEDAGPSLNDWREGYVEKLTTQLPKALVLPMEHTIIVSRRGQRLWIALNKRDLADVRVATWTRSALIPIAVIFFVIGAIYFISLIGSYMSSLSYYYSCLQRSTGYYYNYCYNPSSSYLVPYVFIGLIFFGIGGGIIKANKTRAMQYMALKTARETWVSFARKAEANNFSRQVARPAPRIAVPPMSDEGNKAAGNFCMYCGTPVEKTGAKFCERCGKSLYT